MTQTVSSLISELTLLRFSVCATWSALINKWWTRAGRGPVEMADVWLRQVLHTGPRINRSISAQLLRYYKLQLPKCESCGSVPHTRPPGATSLRSILPEIVWRLEARRCCLYPTATVQVSLCYNPGDRRWQKDGISSQSRRIQSRQDVASLCSALSDEADSNGGLTFGFFPELLR